MSLEDFYNDPIVIIHDGHPNTCEVSFQGKKILGPIDMQVEEDDLLIRESTKERFVVTNAERHRSPRQMGSHMDHCTLTVISEKQARKRQDESTRTQSL